MKVRDVPPRRLLSVEPQTSLAEVAKLMRQEDADSAVVMSGSRLLGIITERDMVRAVADGLNAQQATADVVMSADPATATGDEEVAVVALKMMRLGIRHLPVVDQRGKPVGLISARDLVSLLEQDES